MLGTFRGVTVKKSPCIWERWPLAARQGAWRRAPGLQGGAGVIDMAVAALQPAVSTAAAAVSAEHQHSWSQTAPSLQLFLQAHHNLVELFLSLSRLHAATIIGSGRRHRSESNRVMQLKREGPFNPSYVVPMPKSR